MSKVITFTDNFPLIWTTFSYIWYPQARSSSIGSPKFIGMARLVPEADATMVSDADIERIGMEMTMQYERLQDRNPEDVSKENSGFDVRSTSPDGQRRRIEVNARGKMGAVALTNNEWKRA